jgi:Flp pilus assembly protein TadD
MPDATSGGLPTSLFSKRIPEGADSAFAQRTQYDTLEWNPLSVLSMRILSGLLLLVVIAGASPDVVRRASALYQSTDYTNSLDVLGQDPAPDAENYLLRGKNYLMLGNYKKAIQFFEKALAVSPMTSEYELWLGRAWGRRAESGGWLMAGVSASKARHCFERAVALDPRNREASNDLFDFYLNAPGFLGGGMEKAEAIAKSIVRERPPEYEFEEAQLADRRKDYAAAEAHLRRAMELAPSEAGRIVDLARYVANRGRVEESDVLFEQARKLAPNQPRVAFTHARTDIENHRNLVQARRRLQEYLHASLTPDDPPREEAVKLLRRAGG